MKIIQMVFITVLWSGHSLRAGVMRKQQVQAAAQSQLLFL